MIRVCLKAYVHEPREQWVQNWPGQVVLCVSQIYWTSQVHAALDGIGPTLSRLGNSLQVSLSRLSGIPFAVVITRAKKLPIGGVAAS